MIDESLKSFLENSHILTIATVGEPVWIYNVYYTIDNKLNFIFASSVETTHGKYLEKDNRVAFSVSWVEDWNPQNKKGIQGTGALEILTGIDKIKGAIKLLHDKKGILRDISKYEGLNAANKMYILKPNFIKFKSDEDYGVRGERSFRIKNGKFEIESENITK